MPKRNLPSFRMFTAQLCVQGACQQTQIIKAFGVSKSSVLRSVNKYRQEGSQAELKADPYCSRFLVIFDREGYSPDFFRRLWQEHRIACITYHKFPKKDWPTSEFSEVTATMSNGEQLTMQLAERGSLVGGDGVWMPSGHQTSLISTAFDRQGRQDAVALFSRWCQENFFRYTMEHFAIDALSVGSDRNVENPGHLL